MRATSRLTLVSDPAALATAPTPYAGWVPPGATVDVTQLTALLDLADQSGADLAYADERAPGGERHYPDWSPERLRHQDYFGFRIFRVRALADLAGLETPARQDPSVAVWELSLRIAETHGVVAHLPRRLTTAAPNRVITPESWDAGVAVVQVHLGRTGVRATARRGHLPGLVDLDREPDLTTPVSIVIPTIGSAGRIWGERRSMVVETVRSVATSSRHRATEWVIVYDTPTPQSVLDALSELAAELGLDLKLVEFTEPFNFSAKCNVGALHASHDTLIFLNDDMAAKSEGLVEQLLAPLAEGGVGATGAKLFFEDGRIQHGGVIFGSGSIFHRYYKALPDTEGVRGELWVDREETGLTGACIAVRRELFDAVGGFTEHLPVNFNDVDFCLKLRRAGHRLLWLHGVQLHHFESVSRSGKVSGWEVGWISRRWGSYHSIADRYSSDRPWPEYAVLS